MHPLDQRKSDDDSVSALPGMPAAATDGSVVEGQDIISAVLNTVSALIVVLDRGGRIVRFNRACERITGYSAAEAVGRRVWDLFLPAEEVEPVRAVFEQLRAGAFPLDHKNIWLTKEGDRRLIAWSNTALRDAGGDVVFVIGTGIDITERDAAQRGLEQVSRELAERVSQLNCLHGVSTLVETPGITLPEILQRTAELLPAAWRYADIACARVTLDDQRFATQNFRETPWQHARAVRVYGMRAGQVEVCYLEERPESHEGPFREEEGHLLSTVAKRLGRIVERTRAEQEIERLARFPSENPNPVLRVAGDGSVLYANQASLPLLDVWGAQVGRPLPDEWCRFVLDVLDVGERRDAELKVGERTLALSFAPVAEHGYVNVYGLDITDRKRTQQTLKRSQERYTLAERAARVGSWDWNLRTGELHWSDQIKSMFGFAPGTFRETYKAFLESVHPADRQAVVDAVNASVNEGADYAIDHRIVRPDGSIRWMSETGDVFRDESGKAIRMLGVVQDITERKRAEQRIHEQNEFLSSILESVTHPLYVVDAADYTVQMANSAAYEGALPQGATCYGLFHDRSTPCSGWNQTCPVREIKKTKCSVTVEHVHRDRDGSARVVEVRGYPVFDDEGEVTAVIEYGLDITERKEMEQQLRAARDAAEEARREERRRRREAERRREIAESLTEVLAALNSNQPVDRVLDHIAMRATQLLDAQAAAIYRVSSGPEGMSVKAARCLPQEVEAGVHLPAGQRALEQAVAFRETVAVPDLTTDAEERVQSAAQPVSSTCGGDPLRALIAAPIIVEDEVYGGAVLYYTEPRAFTDEDLELATIFSNQIARAVGNARLREQIQEAAAAAERNRLARDLHDSVTQALFSASLVAETLPRVWQRDPDEAREGLEELRDLTRGALAEMRTLLLELRPSALLKTKLDDLLQQLIQAVTSRSQLPVTANLEPSPQLPPEVQVAFYRVAQEALNNAVRHAEAQELTIRLEVMPTAASPQDDGWQGQMVLHVRDDGRGFEEENHVAGDSLGLGIMRERAEAIGARLSIESETDHGTDVILTWQGSQP